MQTELDAAALNDWIGDRLPDSGSELRVERMAPGTGVANELFWLRRGSSVWVLRRPPAVTNTPGASDMNREWRILGALEGTTVPHPTPLLQGTATDSPMGVPFLIMGAVDGFTPVGRLPSPYTSPTARRELAFAMVDAAADLGQVDYVERGIADLGKPTGFLERQVSRWTKQVDSYSTRDIPGYNALANWLDDNRPHTNDVGLMHGDYSPFNVMASQHDTTRLAAVVDWDTGTIGDPLLDIAHLLARWTEPGEEPAIGTWDIGDGAAEHRDGLPSRHEMAQRYAQQSGRDLTYLPFYQALALFKLASILEGRVSRAQSPDDAAGWSRMVDRLVDFGRQFAAGARR
ncbi:MULTISPECIES: phosphotransferase family protein [Rhodococcus]|uniref:Phosphotransferase family protein n=1 Tax=Rhodococcus oxybenzonivorans TaxID=1990687 RepID=A0AAE5A6N0_9NOCA|nr:MULTISPECIES: phosphotransferase family protein [Rhodococcus]MDV7240543.1 phosphotransferase family protein [Rhodococcus oxybenzonivorans]MDV7265762.1 phosphotransferase family protein [Rhodococcus oxybenzonivorans]MDV7272816.1 phosphotransferase family protein [Rhodococcus oxybenzonivorans]MDV7333445.1 phosphotransferase family protein [Rhodococcus oxybenzonivorans]MDV7342612.1 phosphotransferase family protein [Rhodococcus oxybenzonivorans]